VLVGKRELAIFKSDFVREDFERLLCLSGIQISHDDVQGAVPDFLRNDGHQVVTVREIDSPIEPGVEPVKSLLDLIPHADQHHAG
jgi:hypothetical protein